MTGGNTALHPARTPVSGKERVSLSRKTVDYRDVSTYLGRLSLKDSIRSHGAYVDHCSGHFCLRHNLSRSSSSRASRPDPSGAESG